MEISKSIKAQLRALADKKQAVVLQRFFKTGLGEYGEGDKFLGVKVPIIRKTIKPFLKDISLDDINDLLYSDVHEERFAALVALINGYQKSTTETERKRFYDYYIDNISRINNWDLVDISAPHVVGHYLFDKDRHLLYSLASDSLLWRRRVAIVSTFYFIRQNQFHDTLKITKQRLNDKEDLIHKACGWMLREVGKRNENLLIEFLGKYHQKMPRIMLSYALEKFNPEVKNRYRKK